MGNLAYLVIIGALAGLSMLHVLLTAVLARLFRIPVQRLSFFWGPKIVSTELSGTKIEIGAIPCGGFVEFPPLDPLDPSQGTQLEKAPVSTILLVTLVPWLLLFAAAGSVLDVAPAITAVGRGFWQFPLGGALFWSKGAEYIAAAPNAANSWLSLAALVWTKGIATSFMPIPGSPSGRIIYQLLRRHPPALFLFIHLLLIAGWILAVVVWAVRTIWL